MLEIKVPIGDEQIVESKDGVEFIPAPVTSLKLEHSLASISKWEQIWEKPFLSSTEKTTEETYSYLHCMVLDESIPLEFMKLLTQQNVDEVNKYINSKMTATWFSNEQPKPGGPVITSEIIYSWMAALNVPFECETWHLNRLITLIRVINQQNAPKKKMSPREAMAQQRALNEQRRKQFGTAG